MRKSHLNLCRVFTVCLLLLTTYLQAQNDEIATGDHWEYTGEIEQNMSVLATSINGLTPSEGDQIGAFGLDGDLVGVGDVEDGMCGIAVWGGEPDGLADGEAFELMYWDEDRASEFDIEISSIVEGSNLTYETNDLIVIDIVVSAPPPVIPFTFSLLSVYPNPFNALATLAYSIPNDSHVQLRVFDVSGKEIALLFNGVQSAGPHNMTWNSSSVSSGVYLFLLAVDRKISATRGVLLR